MSQNLSRAIAVFGIDIGKNLMNAVRQKWSRGKRSGVTPTQGALRWSALP